VKICSLDSCLYSFKISRFEIWRFEFCRQGMHAENLTRPDLPLRGGRRIDNPKGDHRRPPTLFSFCELGQGLWDSWLLGSLQTLLEPPGVLLGASWGLLGCSWGGLEGFLGPLGRLLDPLESSWRRSKTRQKQKAFLNPQKCFKKSCIQYFLSPFWEPKIDQNGTQNESKFNTIFKSEKNALQEPLGAVLGRSWGILEVILGG